MGYGIAGPVVLVGESIAGFNVCRFASDHPEQPQASCSWTLRTKTVHMRCREWRDSFLTRTRTHSSAWQVSDQGKTRISVVGVAALVGAIAVTRRRVPRGQRPSRRAPL